MSRERPEGISVRYEVPECRDQKFVWQIAYSHPSAHTKFEPNALVLHARYLYLLNLTTNLVCECWNQVQKKKHNCHFSSSPLPRFRVYYGILGNTPLVRILKYISMHILRRIPISATLHLGAGIVFGDEGASVLCAGFSRPMPSAVICYISRDVL